MRLQHSFREEENGKLYLVPTPIGNLEDMTFRAINILKSVNLIAAEDTRNTQKLLNHFEIKTPQESFHEHNAYHKIPKLIEILKSGQSIAQVSDAGMPSISDPGHDLVKACVKEEIPVIALPGASAGITALIASGLSPQPYTFYGFLPRKKQEQQSFFEEKKNNPETQIFYESPFRVKETLENLSVVYSDREVVLARELTKIYEEYRRGKISEILLDLETSPAKGECLIIVSGQPKQESEQEFEDTPVEAVKRLIESGLKKNEAIKKVAKERKLNRQTLYAEVHRLKS